MEDLPAAVRAVSCIFERNLNLEPGSIAVNWEQVKTDLSFEEKFKDINLASSPGIIQTVVGSTEDNASDVVRLNKGFLDVFDKKTLDMAFHLLNIGPSPPFEVGAETVGELYYMFSVFAPIINMVTSAAKKDGRMFKTDQDVQIGTFLRRVSHDSADREVAHLRGKPDAAVLGRYGLPACVIEIKPRSVECDDELECFLYSACTALRLANHGTFNVPIPSITTIGYTAFLWVTKVEKRGSAPTFHAIKTPDGKPYFDAKCQKDYVRLGCILTALLGNVMNEIAKCEGLFKDVIGIMTAGKNVISRSSTLGKRSTRSSSSRSQIWKSSSAHGKDQGNADESGVSTKEAMKVASLNGLLTALRRLVLSDSSKQRSLRHYFCGTDTESKRNLFVKVIFDERHVDEEVRIQKAARENTIGRCRIPEIVYDDIKSERSIIAMERILNVQDVYPQNVKAYARSLLCSIEALHACGILHCDIKPTNVLWDGTSVVVVDFGHAQMLEGAWSYAGTPGFTAPEVFYDKIPHSELSDAYSVGKTLEQVAAEAYMLHDKTLSKIIVGLTTRKVEERWILSNALEALSSSRLPPVKRQCTEPGRASLGTSI